MAQVIPSPPNFPQRLRDVLAEGLSARGIDAEVEIEKVPDLDMFRVLVTAPKFENLWSSERQGILWRLIEQTFSREEQFHISGIFTLTPKEMAGEA